MKIYLVGGAVRDELMGVSDSDKDWVVVGATPEDLIFEGYTPVGKDFPVFLHPQTGEEYALARTERKTAPGYHGFVFHADSHITLEEDLARRDLTINAIAKDLDGNLIDPFHGKEDIKNKIFRHVSPAFKEDPVRVLRLSRFAARYPAFTIAAETQTLLQQMCEDGEVDALVGERVWQELSKGLMTTDPFRMLEVLIDCGALTRLFPQIQTSDLDKSQLTRVKQALTQAAKLRTPLSVRFAILNFLWPITHLKAPKDCTELAQLLIKSFESISNASTLCAKELLLLLQSCDALRRPERFVELLTASECLETHNSLSAKDSNHLLGTKAAIVSTVHSPKEFLLQMQQSALSIDHKVVADRAIRDGLAAAQIGEAINQARQSALEVAILEYQNSKLAI